MPSSFSPQCDNHKLVVDVSCWACCFIDAHHTNVLREHYALCNVETTHYSSSIHRAQHLDITQPKFSKNMRLQRNYLQESPQASLWARFGCMSRPVYLDMSQRGFCAAIWARWRSGDIWSLAVIPKNEAISHNKKRDPNAEKDWVRKSGEEKGAAYNWASARNLLMGE